MEGCREVTRPGVSGCEVVVAHGAGSGEHEDKESRRCRSPIVYFASAPIFN